jgi:hypothetical protein
MDNDEVIRRMGDVDKWAWRIIFHYSKLKCPRLN